MDLSNGGASLDDYLKLHTGPKQATTFAQKETRQYDFSSVDLLDSDRRINHHTTDQDSFDNYNHNQSKTVRAADKPPKKELQAFCPASQATSFKNQDLCSTNNYMVETTNQQSSNIRRRDRAASNSSSHKAPP